MTENRRIVLNIAATYARSLFGLGAGFLIGRWVLQALGNTDFGLFGVVGGLMAFVGFVNKTLAIANARFYGIAVGECRVAENGEVAIEECRRWFSAAVLIHTSAAFILVGLGYPVGKWLIKNWLTVPPERVAACIDAFGLSSLASFIGMLSVPYLAMYGAKQEIAESTAFSLIGTAGMLVFGWYMVCNPGDWMVMYALVSCLLAVLPSILMVWRAILRYPECRIRSAYLFDWSRIKQVVSYSGWTLIAVVSVLFRTDGIVILINKYFGPGVNAAYSIANQMEGKAEMFNGSLKGAFAPAITNAYGAGDIDRMHKLAFGLCKFGALSSLVFMIPLALEIDTVMRLWLVEPPEFAAGLCIISMIYHVFGMCTQGVDTAVGASGKIAQYLMVSSGIALVTLPVVCMVVWLGGGVYGLAWTLVGMVLLYVGVRIVMASRILNFSCRKWFRRILLPIFIVSLMALSCGALPRFLLPPGWFRLLMTSGVSVVAYLSMAWWFALDADERKWVCEKVLRRVRLCR